MGQVLIRFVSATFEITEGTLTLGPPIISQNLAKFAEAFSTFTLRSGAADIEIDRTGPIQGMLTDIALRRAPGGALTRIKFCSFNQEITDVAIHSGQFYVDLSSYIEVVLRVRQQDGMVSKATVFNLSIDESPIATYDLPIGECGETALLARPGHYRVIAAGGSKRSAIEHFYVGNDEVEPKIIEVTLD
jgi:hypothetical protein